MELVTPRLQVGVLHPDEAAALFALRSDPAVARFQGWCPADVAEVREFIAAQSREPSPTGWFQRAIRLSDGGELIGDLGINLPEDGKDSVEFGVNIAPAHQGRGYASEVVLAVFDQVFWRLARHRIHAAVDPRNLASMAMLRGLGMRQEAHHRQSLWLRGEWVDDVIFAMLRQEWRAAERHRG